MIQESIERLSEIEIPDNPFPGLRPFELHESLLFFGREGQNERLIEKLGRTRFLVIVGTSGSGKSSLVRAGLLPALLGGMMPDTGSVWHIALMRPGNNPIGNLASALNSHDAFGFADEENRNLQIAITEATLRRGNLGLVEAVRQANQPANENLLVITDQFEELFRVEQGAQNEELANDKAAFVKLLLEAGRQREVNVYVVLTMRSDYLGECSQFQDLPEAINESQYLIPRLTRDQLRQTISGPVAVGGAKMTPRLVNRLLNDIGDQQDQLPILQHALMRTWDEWKVKFPDHAKIHQGVAIDVCCYEATGGMADALSTHANMAYLELLGARNATIAEKMFKCLTEKGEDNREVRRPVILREICAVIGAADDNTKPAPEAEVIAVIEKFRAPGRSFLMPPAGTPLNADSLIDISHESLIRNWKRLSEWVEEEAASARRYLRLAETSELYGAAKAALLRDPELQHALNWLEGNHVNEAWANRYHGGHQSARNFLEQSLLASELEKQCISTEILEKELRQKKQLRRTRLIAIIVTVLCVISVVVTIVALSQRKIAKESVSAMQRFWFVSAIRNAHKEAESGVFYEYNYELLKKSPVEMRSFAWYYIWHSSPEATANKTLEISDVPIKSISFSPDGRIFVSGDQNGFIRFWNVQKGFQELEFLKHGDIVNSLQFAPDGVILASAADDGVVKLWDIISHKEVANLRGSLSKVLSITFSPDGKNLASIGDDGIVRLWDIQSRKEVENLQQPLSNVKYLAFSSDGETISCISGVEGVRLWNIRTNVITEIRSAEAKRFFANQSVFSPNGKFLAFDADWSIRVRNIEKKENRGSLLGHSAPVSTLAFTPDGINLASGSEDNTVKIWDLETSEELISFKDHRGRVNAVTFSPDGKILASASDDGTVKLYFAPTDEVVEKTMRKLEAEKTRKFNP